MHDHATARARRPGLSRRVFLAVLFAALLCLLSAPCRPARAADPAGVLAAMSVERKVGQLFCVSFRGPVLSPELRRVIETRHVGGLILYDAWGNVDSPGQVARLAREAQNAALASGHPGLFLAVDQEGGPVARLRRGFAVPPSAMALGASGDPTLAAQAARVTARQMRAVGLNLDFAPVADVNSNPANPIIGVRSFGGDPAAVSRFVQAAVRAYGEEGVLCTVKHFPGHGDTDLDSHLSLPVARHGRERLDAVELPPFAAAVRAGAPAVMTAHVAVPALTGDPGLPATLSARVLTGLLRGELGFDGLVVTDSLGMGAVKRRFGAADCALRAFQAGADVLLYGADKGAEPEDFVPAWERLVRAVRSGELSEARLDASVERILRAKERFGVPAPALPDPALAASRTDTPDQRRAVEAMARAGLTAGRDYGLRTAGRGGELPFPPDEDVLLLWPGAPDALPDPVRESPRLWTLALPADPGAGDVARAVDAARAFRAVAVFTARADRHPGQAALVEALLAAGPVGHLAVASLDAPYDIRSYPSVPCWLAAYSDVPASIRAVLDALAGRATPSGRLPVDLP